MLKIGLTGGIASGKSTVSNYLKEKYGIIIIDADKIAHELSQPQKSIWRGYVDHFGKGVLLPSNELNKEYIANKVFSIPEEKKWMDKMTHPLIETEVKMVIEERKLRGDKVVVLDIPLLFEVKWEYLVDVIWVVSVNKETQVLRLMERNKLSLKDAEKRIFSQMLLEEKVARATDVIDNSNCLESTYAQVDKLWGKYVAQDGV